MMIRKFIIIGLALLILTLTSCGITSITTSSEDENRHPWIVSVETAEQFETYLKDKNADAICKMFCPAVPVSIDEVQDLLNTIDGKIVSLEEGSVISGLKESRNGIYTVYTYVANSTIYTDCGHEYKVNIAGTVVFDGYPEEVGIERIRVINEATGIKYSIGRGG